MDGPLTELRRLGLAAALLAWGLMPGASSPAGMSGTLRDDGPNRADVERRERGYYESLLDAGRRLDEPEARGAHAPTADRPFDAGPLTLAVADVREFVLKPRVAIEHRGAPWSTNAFGMRDRPYEARKPAGTRRIALVGDSIGAGWGVADGAGFEPALERSLDARSRASGGPRVEILNFAVPGLAPGQRWESFTLGGGWGYGPDLVIYQATPADAGWDERRLRVLLGRGLGLDARVYAGVLARVGVKARRDAETYKRQLRPLRRELLAGVYRTIAEDCRARGVPSVWVLVPRVGKPAPADERAGLAKLAEQAGFTAVIDLSGVFDGLDPATLAVAPDDFHPNVSGHDRLARRLERELDARRELTRDLGSATDSEARP